VALSFRTSIISVLLSLALLSFRKGSAVRLFSRNQLPQHHPAISEAILGALLLGYFEGEEFVFAGKVGTGFDNKQLVDLRTRLDEIEIAQTPFTRAVGLPRLRAHWVRPEVVGQVAFVEWTVHGKLRHGRFLGFRGDTTAREVVREEPRSTIQKK
jgi:bifunctional non-homologous end joining protein LigD